MKILRKISRTLAMFLVILTIAAGLHVTTVSAAGLNKTSVTLVPGKSVTLTVSGASKITWKSGKTAVATVSAKGVVTAKAAGTAKVTATVGKKTYTCTVNVLKQTTALDNNTNGMTAAEARVYKAMLAQRSVLKEGMKWTNANSYQWKGGIFTKAYGCSAFAQRVSDAAFGSAKAKRHTNFNNIKVGDIIRMENNTHTVIVMKVVGNTVVVAEGNINSKIHWGRKITLTQIKKTGTYVMTRYS